MLVLLLIDPSIIRLILYFPFSNNYEGNTTTRFYMEDIIENLIGLLYSYNKYYILSKCINLLFIQVNTGTFV